MSHVAIAAALSLEDVSAGERLAASSLASFANREHRAWPGTRVAAVRAGLSRSQYLAARDALEERGLVVVEAAGGGRGHSPVVALAFAQTGPWFDGEINAALFEAVLSYSRTPGSTRLLLAALAALADDDLVVSGMASGELRAAAGMADSTYRRARTALLASGEVVLDIAGGGRAKTNTWRLTEPRANPQPLEAPRRRVAPSSTALPLIATVKPSPVDASETAPKAAGGGVKSPGLTGVSVTTPGQDRTVCGGKGPGLSGLSAQNPAQNRTVWAQTPPQTPPPHARREGNPRTQEPAPPAP